MLPLYKDFVDNVFVFPLNLMHAYSPRLRMYLLLHIPKYGNGFSVPYSKINITSVRIMTRLFLKEYP